MNERLSKKKMFVRKRLSKKKMFVKNVCQKRKCLLKNVCQKKTLVKNESDKIWERGYGFTKLAPVKVVKQEKGVMRRRLMINLK